MLLKIINNNIIKKTTVLIMAIFLILSIFAVSYAENYEWSVINNMKTIETNGTAQNKISNAVNNSKDTLNLDCGSAILIEQNSRSNSIRTKCT